MNATAHAAAASWQRRLVGLDVHYSSSRGTVGAMVGSERADGNGRYSVRTAYAGTSWRCAKPGSRIIGYPSRRVRWPSRAHPDSRGDRHADPASASRTLRAAFLGLVVLAVRPDAATLLVVAVTYSNAAVIAVRFHDVPFALAAGSVGLLAVPLAYFLLIGAQAHRDSARDSLDPRIPARAARFDAVGGGQRQCI